jgi:hypothetical protein
MELFHDLGDTNEIDHSQPLMHVQRAVVADAHMHGIIAAGHTFSYECVIDLLEAGVNSMTHMFIDKAPKGESEP